MSKRKSIIFRFWGIVLVCILAGCTDSFVGEGYTLKSARDDFVHLEKNGKIVIPPTITSYKVTGRHIFGAGVEAKRLSCDDGGGYKIRVEDNAFYFIFDKNAEDLSRYLDKNRFLEAASKIEGFDESFIDFSKAQRLKNRFHDNYKNVDFSSCESIPNALDDN